MISVKAASRSGTEVAKTLQGAFRAIAREDSRLKEKKIIIWILKKKARKKKGKSTCGKNGLATKECGNLVVGQVEQAHVLLPGDLWWSGHREIYNCERKKKKNK